MATPSTAAVPEHLAVRADGACACFTQRGGGVSTGPFASLNVGADIGDDPAAVAENLRRLAAIPGAGGLTDPSDGGVTADGPAAAPERTLVLLEQVHGTRVAVHRQGQPVDDAPADAQVTDRRDLSIAVRTADCVPIALLAPWGVGVVHAGWRGLAGGVIAAAVRALADLAPGGSTIASIHAAIGPAAEGCCYEVGDGVRAALGADAPGPSDGRPHGDVGGDDATETTGGRRTVDLRAIAARELRASGVSDIETVGRCTICDPASFSYRASGGTTGRQAVLAWRA